MNERSSRAITALSTRALNADANDTSRLNRGILILSSAAFALGQELGFGPIRWLGAVGARYGARSVGQEGSRRLTSLVQEGAEAVIYAMNAAVLLEKSND